jgi:hypothetical protein
MVLDVGPPEDRMHMRCYIYQDRSVKKITKTRNYFEIVISTKSIKKSTLKKEGIQLYIFHMKDVERIAITIHPIVKILIDVIKGQLHVKNVKVIPIVFA